MDVSGPRPVRALAALLLVMLLAPAASGAAEDEAERAPPAFPTTEFSEGAREASVTDSGITARITYERRPKIDRDRDVPVLGVFAGKRQLLDLAGVASGMDVPAATASIAEIDPYRLGKEVYFSSYSGGAHCCTRVVVAEDGRKAGRGSRSARSMATATIWRTSTMTASPRS